MDKAERDAIFASIDESIAELDEVLGSLRRYTDKLASQVMPPEPLVPWIRSVDGSAWMAVLPSGKRMIVARMHDGMFRPYVDNAYGPKFDGPLGATDWCVSFLAGYVPAESLVEDDQLVSLD